MKQALPALLCLAALCCASLAFAETYDVIHREHQPEDKARHIEAANIYVITCGSHPEDNYYIYQYFRGEGRPNFRAIEPPEWGAPIGGMDYHTFETAVCAACAKGEVEAQNAKAEQEMPEKDASEAFFGLQ